MKNYSLVILLWIACTSFAMAYGNNAETKKPQVIATLSIKKVEPTDNIRFSILSDSQSIFISNAAPIKELRVYDHSGKLIDTSTQLSHAYNYSTSELAEGKYAFNIQVADKVVTHIYEKE